MGPQDQSFDETRFPDDFPVAPVGKMTEDEFVAWCDEDTRAEWVDGEVVMMSPANIEHLLLASWLHAILQQFVEWHGLGVVLADPQVRFAGQARRRVPDLVFLAKDRFDLLKRAHLEGPPDLIVEIVSPDSAACDWREKYLDYQAAGVREYWVLDPMSQHTEVYALEAAPESPTPAADYRRLKEQEGAIASTVLGGFRFRIEWLWPATRPTVEAALQALGLPPRTGT